MTTKIFPYIYIGFFVILFILIIVILPNFVRLTPNKKHIAKGIEEGASAILCKIYNAQELFKNQKIKDQNNNGIGEYGTTDELAKYILEEGKDKTKLAGFMPIGKDGNLVYVDGYMFRVFLPPQIDEQERYWLCLAIPEPSWHRGYLRSYFLDNKKDMIFYAEKNALKELVKEYKLEEWSLRKIFWGEPFKSPINTSIWKILNTSDLIGYRFTDGQDENKEPDKPK